MCQENLNGLIMNLNALLIDAVRCILETTVIFALPGGVWLGSSHEPDDNLQTSCLLFS